MATSVAVLGSTGSIGTQTLDVVRSEAGRYQICALGAASSVELLAAQAQEFRPEVVVIADDSRVAELKALVPAGTSVLGGREAMADVAPIGEVVVNAVVGFAGLGVTVSALSSGRRLALANKESLISAGPVVQPLRGVLGAELIPVDSEHCAIHQCLRSGREISEGQVAGVKRMVLTASGGPFRGRSRDELLHVSIDDALAHPTWSMGPKITIDSSTLMNKGLEVIEAHELFGIGYDNIEVVVHPQSIVHSMVEFSDGATIAQLSRPDMRLPIAYALAYPDRSATDYGSIDWSKIGSLDFESPDFESFPCLGLAFEAGRVGGSAPAWLNASNEIAVDAFLAGRISWHSIADVLTEALDHHERAAADTVDEVMEVDAAARAHARSIVERRQ